MSYDDVDLKGSDYATFATGVNAIVLTESDFGVFKNKVTGLTNVSCPYTNACVGLDYCASYYQTAGDLTFKLFCWTSKLISTYLHYTVGVF